MLELLYAAFNTASLITLAVIGGAIVLFIGGWIAPEITGLLALALLIATGVLKPGEALQGFGSPALITVMVAAVGPVSAFVPNTPIEPALLPVIESWCHRRKVSPSRVLLTLSFAIVLGGTITLFGSSVNLFANEVSEKIGYGASELFCFTPIAIGIAVWVLALMVSTSKQLITSAKAISEGERFN